MRKWRATEKQHPPTSTKVPKAGHRRKTIESLQNDSVIGRVPVLTIDCLIVHALIFHYSGFMGIQAQSNPLFLDLSSSLYKNAKIEFLKATSNCDKLTP